MKNKNRNRYGVRLKRRITKVKPPVTSATGSQIIQPESALAESGAPAPALAIPDTDSVVPAKPAPPPIRVIIEGEKSSDV